MSPPLSFVCVTYLTFVSCFVLLCYVPVYLLACSRKFAAMTVRLCVPRTTCLLFGSGRVVCTGASTLMKCRLSVCEILNIVRACGYDSAEVRDFHVQNIVASFNYGQQIDLELLFREYQTESNFGK